MLFAFAVLQIWVLARTLANASVSLNEAIIFRVRALIVALHLLFVIDRSGNKVLPFAAF